MREFGIGDIYTYGEVCDGVLHIKDSFELVIDGSGCYECAHITALASYMGEAPHISFELTVDGQSEALYKSPIYRIGKDGEYTCQSWRVPPAFLPGMKMSVKLDVPEGTELLVRNFGIGGGTVTNIWNGGPRHNAHLGFWDMAPDNTMPALELAAMCGFPACIVVPKVTADGVLVCIHDDTINKTARDENGNPPDGPTYVWDMTYDELLRWEYGSHKNEIYKGTKIPLLEDFFGLCARTGMRPMFSTHPGLTVEQWKQVKDMLIKHGLLKIFHIKSFELEVLKTAYSVFGTEIDGYTWDNDEWSDSIIEDMLSSGIDIKGCRVGVEIRFNHYTKEIAEKIISAGMFAAAWSVKRRTSEEYERVISYGVTEFTEDNHCSMGLNW